MTNRSDINCPQTYAFRKGYYAHSRKVRLKNSAGMMSASMLRIYPPGIPILTYGQKITTRDISTIQSALDRGQSVGGGIKSLSDTISVYCETSTFGPCKIYLLDVAQLSENQISKFSNFFRETFSNPPYSQFAFHKKKPFDPLMPDRFFTKGSEMRKPYYDLEYLDSIELPEDYERYMEPCVTRNRLADRFNDDGYLVVLEELNSGKFKGVLHGRAASLERLFKSEEWYDPLLFSSRALPRTYTDEQKFYRKMNFHCGLTSQCFAFTISAQAIHPDYRGKHDYFFKMMAMMANAITNAHAHLPFMAESNTSGPAHILNAATNDRVLHGILENGHSVIISKRLSNSLWYYQGERRRLSDAIRRAVKTRRKPFNPDPEDSSMVVLKKVSGKGMAVFATERIAAGETIARFRGEVYRSKSATQVPPLMIDHCLQIGPELFIYAKNKLAEYVNHSCNPNCGIRDHTQIFAVSDIRKGEELTWDYRCSENSDWVLDRCLCGSESCDGRIMGFDSLPEKKKTRYLQAGMVSEWITRKDRDI